ncbi:MAG: TIGR04282 family arsenosugar biosynthesis glycosyltransferase [Candidatus Aureabacteria bacterium]|nr:TIGR04282 family arsenosugar biosynthesis glycosyltransferase [Candidatus Auribacterota bacterium]
MKRILIIFAKEPVRGKVKTRLAPHLSQTKCLALYKELLEATVALARGVKCGKKIIAYDFCGRNPSFLKKIASDFEFYKQNGKDLGARMFDAFETFVTNNTKAVIIGSDSPDLPRSYISRAFEMLSKNDLVLGPAYDGGYYLIGLKEPCKKIFEGIKWSSGSVFERTLEKAKKLKKKAAVLNSWHDIDTPEDLKYFKGRHNHEI